MNKINSYTGDYRWLSNFWLVVVTYDDVEYPSVEHAYQAAKFAADTMVANPANGEMINLRELIRSQSTPGKSKTTARKYKKFIRAEWEQIKIDVMMDLNLQKFMNHPDLMTKLINTGDADLEEGNKHGDRFWGTVDGDGENRLGKIHMKIRDNC